jgi:hypothetical protein
VDSSSTGRSPRGRENTQGNRVEGGRLMIRRDGRDALLDEQAGCLIRVYMRAAFRLCLVFVQ